MFEVGDIVVHKCDICKITYIVKDFREGEDYYTLAPLYDNSLIIHTPVSNKYKLLRHIISGQDAEIIIQKIPNIKIIEADDDRALEGEYSKLINSGKHEDLVRIIKTTYLHKEEKENNGKKANEKDKKYFKQAEKLFYTELSIALGKTYQETKEYIANALIQQNNTN
jgi:CarD family transcriptional regulator